MKWTLKQWLLLLPYFLFWCVILLFQGEARSRYIMGKSRGMHCYKSEDVSKFIYGSVTEYSYNSNIKPYKEYMTWNEYWRHHGYLKQREL